MQWNLDRPEIPESAVSLHMLRYSTSYHLNLTASIFRQNVN